MPHNLTKLVAKYWQLRAERDDIDDDLRAMRREIGRSIPNVATRYNVRAHEVKRHTRAGYSAVRFFAIMPGGRLASRA